MKETERTLTETLRLVAAQAPEPGPFPDFRQVAHSTSRLPWHVGGLLAAATCAVLVGVVLNQHASQETVGTPDTTPGLPQGVTTQPPNDTECSTQTSSKPRKEDPEFLRRQDLVVKVAEKVRRLVDRTQFAALAGDPAKLAVRIWIVGDAPAELGRLAETGDSGVTLSICQSRFTAAQMLNRSEELWHASRTGRVHPIVTLSTTRGIGLIARVSPKVLAQGKEFLEREFTEVAEMPVSVEPG